MIVILEGVDKTGKTTIAEKLAKRRKLTNFRLYQKHTLDFNESDKWPWYVGGMNIAVMNACKAFDGFIMDRFHLSEHVYSTAMERKAIIPFSVMDRFLHDLNKKVFVFLLDTDWETYMERCDKNTRRFTKEEFDTQRFLFNAAFKDSELPGMNKIPSAGVSIAGVVEHIGNIIDVQS